MASAPAPTALQKTSLAGTLLVTALVIALAWQLAYWTWNFAAPARQAAVPAAGGDVDMTAVARLFGASAPGSPAQASTSGLRLKGVIAPTPGVAASAIFSLGSGRDVAVYIEREVQPGVKLKEVKADHVIVARAGVDERIDLETARSTVATAGGVPGGHVLGFKLNVSRSGANNYTISRKELDLALRDPNQLNYLGAIGAPTKGGVRMQAAPPNSLAQKLGLQPGDVIKKVNGQDVASAGDLARLYTQFATLSMVQAEVQRGSAMVQLSYSINP
ncbi:MAG: type II secretion system protein N [Usitatibacter sp.]